MVRGIKGVSMRGLFLQPALLVVIVAASVPARATHPPGIEAGFRLLYETRFEEARAQFLAYEKNNPEDPLGHAWEAASYLFEEFFRQGVFSSKFFLEDKKLLEGVEGKPNGEFRRAFFTANMTAQNLARRLLAVNPSDPQALFALTITTGMLADYASLIDKRKLESLKFIRESETYANKLLAVKPDSVDAYLALGVANYVIGSLPPQKRFLLWLGGISGDRRRGMAQLALAAAQGEYLRPFAKILLALVALREKQVELARTQLEELAAQFPQNPLFGRELALLGKSTSRASAGE